MKKLVQVCVLSCLCANVSAQPNLKTEFETFIINFDMCQYPFYSAWGENKEDSECDKKHGGGISREHDRMFVTGQGLKPFAWSCDLDNFLGYAALFQLSTTDSAYLLIFGLNVEETYCGDGLLLASYSKQTYQLQDTLTIYSNGSTKSQYINGKRILQGAYISSFLTEDSFRIFRDEGFYFDRENGYKKLKTVKYHTTYIVTEGGKFIKRREEIDEEIFDEIGRQIEFPKIPFLGRR